MGVVNQWLVPAVLASALVAGCDTGSGMMMGGHARPASYASNGERIYSAGTSVSGSAITLILKPAEILWEGSVT